MWSAQRVQSVRLLFARTDWGQEAQAYRSRPTRRARMSCSYVPSLPPPGKRVNATSPQGSSSSRSSPALDGHSFGRKATVVSTCSESR